MAELPIRSHALEYSPDRAPGGADGYRWHVHLEENDAAVEYLVVDLTGTEATRTRLGTEELDAKVEHALQRLASSRLSNHSDPLAQAAEWNAPVLRRAEHFG